MTHLNLNAQTHLFVGSSSVVNSQTIDLLQTIFCNENKCKKCAHCNQISKMAYENLLWLKPEKQYNLDHIDEVMKKISLTLEKDKKFFIVFEQADLLTIACSNRLLKSIEEPATGYYFIFLTERPQSILPTILSRCVLTNFENKKNDQFKIYKELEISEIGRFFISSNSDPIEFLKVIEKTLITEFESIDLIDKLIEHWSIKCKNSIINNSEELKINENRLKILHQAFQIPPMPGSSKIFWKNLFIQFYA